MQPGPSGPSQPFWSQPPQPPYYAGPPVYVPPPPPRRASWPLVISIASLVLALVVVSTLVVAPAVGTYIHPTSYVYGDQDDAVLVQWVEHDGALTGSLATTYWSPKKGQGSIKAESAAFTGIRDGSRITLTFSALSGTGTSGTLGFRSLTLDWPQDLGGVQHYTLKPGDANDYNDAVSAVRRAHPGATSKQ